VLAAKNLYSDGHFDPTSSILYMRGGNLKSLDVFDVRTGTLRRTITFDLAPQEIIDGAGFSVHPEGKRILLATARLSFDIWMVDGFAPPGPGGNWWRRWASAWRER
jgi:hypothetical protein